MIQKQKDNIFEIVPNEGFNAFIFKISTDFDIFWASNNSLIFQINWNFYTISLKWMNFKRHSNNFNLFWVNKYITCFNLQLVKLSFVELAQNSIPNFCKQWFIINDIYGFRFQIYHYVISKLKVHTFQTSDPPDQRSHYVYFFFDLSWFYNLTS